MTKEEVQALLTEIGTTEDPSERRSKLASLTDEVNSIFEANDALKASETKLKGDVSKLQAYNMDLFLRVGGGQKTPETAPEEKTEPRKFENLFDDKGELK